jgi:hypothetical protein
VKVNSLKHINRLIPTIFVSILLIGVLIGVVIGNLKSDTTTVITSVSPLLMGSSVSIHYKVHSDASDFTVIALPDTQNYSETLPEYYHSQTQWIAENVAGMNIVFVSHLGDIVNNRDDETQWQVADAAMSRLDGLVPYSMLPGNHDMEIGGSAPYYVQYFPASRYEREKWWGGSYNHNKNNFQLFSAGGDDYIAVHLQYCPPDDSIAWANKVLKLHADRKAIISTHVYLTAEGKHNDHCNEYSDGKNQGKALWNKLVKVNPNVFLVLAGHIPGVAQRTDSPNGTPVYQLLSDYQGSNDGHLRVMKFYPNEDYIQVTTYSPILDNYYTDPENQFVLPFEMTGGIPPTGYVTISSGTDTCTASLEQAQCELTLTSNKATISATYSGDENYKASRSEIFEINLK